MSGNLTISFAPDMPPAAVEVVAPDEGVVARIMMEAHRSKTMPVPSEASYLRIHLPSGQVVTLEDPGNFSRLVSMQSIDARIGSAVRPSEVREVFSDYQLASAKTDTHLDATVRRGHVGTPLTQKKRGVWEYRTAPELPANAIPATLSVVLARGCRFEMSLPGDVHQLAISRHQRGSEKAPTTTIRIASSESAADAILGYLQRGDLYAAEAMTAWIDEARDMLLHKKRNPYAAAVGAYLLLRLKQFDKLRDWPRNLADWFDFLPDGCVLWAWQLINEAPSRKDEIRTYLLRAVERGGLPIYTEGLRLLSDGLRLLGKHGLPAREELASRMGVVVWSSPLSGTIVKDANHVRAVHPGRIDVAFAALRDESSDSDDLAQPMATPL